MLSVSLVFVGIALIINGFTPLLKTDKKSVAVINFLVGSMIVFFNLTSMLKAKDNSEYLSALGGLLFGFTNLFIALDASFKIESRPFGIYCLFSTACAIILSVYYFYKSEMLFGTLWMVWLFIWLFAFISSAVTEKFEKPAAYMFIIQGVVSTFGVGMLGLLGAISL